jgi:ClpP class serine protease
MLDSTQLVKDVGTMLEGEEAVREGLIDEVGGISQAFAKLHELIEKRSNSSGAPFGKPHSLRAELLREKNNDMILK